MELFFCNHTGFMGKRDTISEIIKKLCQTKIEKKVNKMEPSSETTEDLPLACPETYDDQMSESLKIEPHMDAGQTSCDLIMVRTVLPDSNFEEPLTKTQMDEVLSRLNFSTDELRTTAAFDNGQSRYASEKVFGFMKDVLEQEDSKVEETLNLLRSVLSRVSDNGAVIVNKNDSVVEALFANSMDNNVNSDVSVLDRVRSGDFGNMPYVMFAMSVAMFSLVLATFVRSNPSTPIRADSIQKTIQSQCDLSSNQTILLGMAVSVLTGAGKLFMNKRREERLRRQRFCTAFVALTTFMMIGLAVAAYSGGFGSDVQDVAVTVVSFTAKTLAQAFRKEPNNKGTKADNFATAGCSPTQVPIRNEAGTFSVFLWEREAAEKSGLPLLLQQLRISNREQRLSLVWMKKVDGKRSSRKVRPQIQTCHPNIKYYFYYYIKLLDYQR